MSEGHSITEGMELRSGRKFPRLREVERNDEEGERLVQAVCQSVCGGEGTTKSEEMVSTKHEMSLSSAGQRAKMSSKQTNKAKTNLIAKDDVLDEIGLQNVLRNNFPGQPRSIAAIERIIMLEMERTELRRKAESLTKRRKVT